MGPLEFFQRRLHGPSRRGDQWPPPDVRDWWEKVQEWRRRYANDRDQLLMYNETFNTSRDRSDLYTPVPLAREMARLSSSLLFSASPVITHSSYQDEVDQFLKINGFEAFLQDTGEVIANEGRGAFRVGYHPDVADGLLPNVTFVREDQILWHRYDRFMVGGTVVIEHEDPEAEVVLTPQGLKQRSPDGTVYRLLESHGRGWIDRKLYKGNSNQLGSEIGWDESVVEDLFPDYVDMPKYVETGLAVPCLVEWSNVPGSASDIAGLELYLDRLDEAESLLLDKGRKSVPVTFADESMVEGTSAALSFPGVVFLKSAGYLPADGNPYVETIQPGFDVVAHLEWVKHVRDSILMMAGYSPSAYGLDDPGQSFSGKALKLSQARTLLHKAGKDRMAMEAIKTVIAVALAYQHNAKEIEPFRPEVALGDGLPEDPIENAQQIQLEDTANAISLAEKIRVIRKHWTEERVQEEVEAKMKEDQDQILLQQSLDLEVQQQKAPQTQATSPASSSSAYSQPTPRQKGDGSKQAKSGSNPKNSKARGVSGDSNSGPARKDQR